MCYVWYVYAYVGITDWVCGSSLAKFFQVVVTFLQVHIDRFCIASTAGVRSPSSSARHDSLHLKGLRVYLRPVVCICCILLTGFWITVNLSILRNCIRHDVCLCFDVCVTRYLSIWLSNLSMLIMKLVILR